MKDCKNFHTKIEEFKLYIVKFEKDNIIKPKLYLFNCIVEGDKC